ncbi:MAG: hypothetical protein KDA88_01010 [Planctomycetaceae bacterium]|nr:hypothetical protein [Planctomycetaceae bacterium]MCB9952447.1 hypothetical protein [Planctomycetaceae bacterium]
MAQRGVFEVTYVESLLWTLFGALLVAACDVPICLGIERLLARSSRRNRQLLWCLLFIPLFTPTLLTGYAYANFSLSLIRHTLMSRGLYLLLLGFKFLAVGTLTLVYTPPPASPSSLHAAQLLLPQSGGEILWSLRIRSFLRRVVPCFAILFVLVFQEFELSSIMVTDTWTVRLFDEQALGVTVAESLRRAVVPVLIQIGFLTLCYSQMRWGTRLRENATQLLKPLNFGSRTILWITVLAAVLLVTLFPFFFVSRSAGTGILTVLKQKHTASQLLVAVGYGLSTGLAAFFCARWLTSNSLSDGKTAHLAKWLAPLLVIPGLFGSFLVSLSVQSLFQLDPLLFAYNSVIPAAIALFLFLLPRAVVVLLAMQQAGPQEHLHLARILPAEHSTKGAVHELQWRLLHQPAWLAAAILCLWGYFELTPLAILAPPGINSIMVQLYNQVHFGRGVIVSGLLLISVLVPMIILLVVFGGRKLFAVMPSWFMRR